MKSILKILAIVAAILAATSAAASLTDNHSAAAADDEQADSTAQSIVFSPSDSFVILHEKTGEYEVTDIMSYCARAVMTETIVTDAHPEALKAQAVAAATYAVRRRLAAELSAHEWHITDDSSVYQTILTEDELKQVYGNDYENALQSAYTAARAVSGEILIYGGIPIIAAFHTADSGMTMPVTVLGSYAADDYPYLSPVESAGDLISPYYGTEKKLTVTEFSARLNAEYGGDNILENEDIIVFNAPEGCAAEVRIGNLVIPAADFRRIFSVSSPVFKVTSGESITIVTYGKGHGVGMSICGAQHMAENGSTYREILAHYYPSAELYSSQ